MMKKYYKNFILCGYVDFHCLLCEETFPSVEEVEKHIRWEQHRKRIKNQSYVSKFFKDAIYKIGTKFYCELCNFVAENVAATNVHIQDTIHAFHKANPKLEFSSMIECKRDSDFVIVCDIIVSNAEWNAIPKRKCFLCDVDVDKTQLDYHIKTREHVMKLIQARVVSEHDDQCYRKIDPEHAYCFICKKIVPTESLSGHWDEDEHLNNTEISINRTYKYTGERVRQNETLKKLMEIQKLLFNIDVRAGKATCKLCETVVDLKFNPMMEHQAGHAGDKIEEPEKEEDAPNTSTDEEVEVVFSEVTDHGKRRAELARYGKKHNIKLNKGGSKGYCSVCNTQISANMKMFKEHVRGWQHKGLLEHKGLKKEKTTEKADYMTKPLQEHLQSVFHSPALQVMWLNAEFCVNNLSFLFIAPVRDISPSKKKVCFVCDMEFKSEDTVKHLSTARHKTKMIEPGVVSTLTREFIREIRPNLFHCGFCNRLIPYYENIQRHFRNWIHRRQRINKDLSSEVAQDWFNECSVVTFSTNPDVLYLQVVSDLYVGEISKKTKKPS